jgi:hypothetical protein
MLVKADKSMLGDKYLRDREAVAKVKEENAAAAAQNKIPDQDILEKREMAMGLMLQPNELIRRLEKLNPKIIIEAGGVRNAVAVRYPKPQEDGTIEKAYVTGFYVDAPLPEFSSVIVDSKGLPVRELRGWRSVLLALYRQKIVTLKQLELSFGKAQGQRAILWDKQTSERSIQ